MRKKRAKKQVRLDKILTSEKQEVDLILHDVQKLRKKLLEKRPSHYKARDIITAFFASLVIATTFVFKGAMIDVSQNLTGSSIFLIIVATSVLLTLQIYFISYTRVEDKSNRPFLQFWAKRFFSLYGVAILVSVFLCLLYGLYRFTWAPQGLGRLVVALSFPATIGAAIPSLMKKY